MSERKKIGEGQAPYSAAQGKARPPKAGKAPDARRGADCHGLAAARKRIDAADRSLRESYLERLDATDEVARIKCAQDAPAVYVPEREKQILERVGADLSPERAGRVRRLFAQIMRASRSSQYRALAGAGKLVLPEPAAPTRPKRVLVQGARGAYQHLAAMRAFPEAPVEFCPSFEDVFSRLAEEDAGVVPLENSTAGVVGDVFDCLYRERVYLCGSMEIALTHALVGRGDFAGVDTVLAHPQALKQCERFLRENNLRGVPCTNNAVAAKMAAESDSENVAAICARECADIYGLRVLRDGVADEERNTTRFVILKRRFERTAAERVAVILRAENRPGALFEVLGVFAECGVNVLALHSRPWRENPFEYLFYLEFAGRYESAEVRALLGQLSEELPFVKLLGTF